MNKTITLGVALVLGLAAPALAQQDPIKVGTIFPLSGGAGPDGQSVTNAVKLAIEQLNQALKLDPNNQEAKKMLEILKQFQK